MYECMYRWVDGYGQIDGSVDRCMNVCINGLMDECWVDGSMNGQIDGSMDR